MNTVLVVDDERSTLHTFERVFAKEPNVRVVTAEDGAAAIRAVRDYSPDVVILDVMLPDQTGLEVFARLKSIDRQLPVLFVTADGDSATAIQAVRLGAFDYLSKPVDFAIVRRLVQRAFEIRRLMAESSENGPQRALPVASNENPIVGRSPGIQQVYKAIGRVAAQNVTVLIRGASGTGKELVARALYQHSNRRSGPFLAVNCAAIPEALLESELLGHEKGAFTGADRRRVGKFEQCSGGTLFLDEIGDMPALLQSKLLRVLQEQRFERVGGEATIQTDVRVIAATNRDMEKMVHRGEFRGDLYYRLNGYTITIPPLRDRIEDLPALIDYFLATANRDYGRDVQRLTPDSLAILQGYAWPGNIRELQSVIRQAVLDTTGPAVFPDALPVVVRQPRNPLEETVGGIDPVTSLVARLYEQGRSDIYDEVVESVERQVITQVLRATGGNQGEASERLGITRTTLRTKLRKLDILIDRVVHPRDDEAEDSED